MKKTLRIAVLVTLAVAVLGAQTRSPADLYQDALHLQDVKGDLPAAIAIYKTIVERHAGDRVLAAKSLLQLGACYEKLGRSEARQAYERIVRDYADVSDVATRAREQLSAIRAAADEPFKVRTLDPVLEAASLDGRYQIYPAGATATAVVKDPREPAGRIALRDIARGFQPSKARHRDVHQDDVGLEFHRQIDGRPPVGRLADDLEVAAVSGPRGTGWPRTTAIPFTSGGR